MTRVRSLGVGALVVFAMAVLWWAQDRALAHRASLQSEDDVLYLPRPSVLRAVSLGHTELVADLVFVRAVIYFGAQLQGPREFRWLENYLSTIVALDPDWEKPYRWSAVATMYNGRTITNDSVAISNRFLELGVQHFPHNWEFPFMLGCNYLFEMQPTNDRERAEWQRIGGDYIRRAALVGGGPPWVPLLAATILRKEGATDAALRHLEEVYASTPDPRTKEEVRNRLISLQRSVDVERTESGRRAFEAEWKKSYPYLSPDLFVLVGPVRPATLDYRALAPRLDYLDDDQH